MADQEFSGMRFDGHHCRGLFLRSRANVERADLNPSLNFLPRRHKTIRIKTRNSAADPPILPTILLRRGDHSSLRTQYY